MTTRRDFISQAGALAGVAASVQFVGCELFPQAHAQVRRRADR